MRVPSVPSIVLLLATVIWGCVGLPSVPLIGKTIKNVAGSASDLVDGATNITKVSISTAYDQAKDGVNNVYDQAKDGVDTAFNTSLGDAVSKAASATRDGVSTAYNSTKVAIIGAANATKEAAVSVKDAVVDVVNPGDVCYDGLECFSMSSPWYSILRPLPKPQSPEFINTQFYLYTRTYPGRYTVTWRYCNDTDTDADANAEGGMTLAGSDFDGSKKTFFITHGFASDGNSSWLADMKDALLKRFDCNVFLVDWGKGASMLNYFQVASNTRVVAAVLSKLGHLLVEEYNADPSRMHAIGHSLGAQISAYFAKNMTTLGRLTALDPAQPAFEHYDRRVRLDANDAALVDVVHTSARPFLPFAGLGMVDAFGHIDFYMNGGWKQPGCYWPDTVNITSFSALANITVEVLANLIACPHARSYEFFTASLGNNNTFWGHRIDSLTKFFSTLTAGYGGRLFIPSDEDCDAVSCSPFGYDAFDYPGRGIFGVATTDSFPFVVPEPKVDSRMRQFRGLTPRDETPTAETDHTTDTETDPETEAPQDIIYE